MYRSSILPALWAVIPVLAAIAITGTVHAEGEPIVRVVPGADWVGTGVDLLGFHLDERGYPKSNLGTSRKDRYLIKGINDSGSDTKFSRKQLGQDSFRVPTFLQAKSHTTDSAKTYASTSLQELHTQTSKEYSFDVNYNSFSANYTSNSKKKRDHSQSTYYGWSNGVHRRHILLIRDDVLDEPAEHLTELFKKRLYDSNYSPDELFRKYGTHLVTRVAIGWRQEMWTTKTATEDTTEESFERSVKAGFAAYAEGTAKFSGNEQEKKTFEESMHEESSHGSEDRWEAIGLLLDDDTLIGIWKLCDDPKRSAELKEAYDIRAALKAISEPTVFTTPPGNEAAPGKDVSNQPHPERTLTVPKDYKILSGGATVTPWFTSWLGDGHGVYYLTDSYPDGERTWKARTEGRQDTRRQVGEIVVSVIAIHDPDDHWEIAHLRHTTTPRAAADPTLHHGVMMDVEKAQKDGYTITGLGVQIHAGDLFSKRPLLHTLSLQGGSPLQMKALAQNTIETKDVHVTGYLVAIRPKSPQAKQIVIEWDTALTASNTVAYSSQMTAYPKPTNGAEFKLVGGGAYVWPSDPSGYLWGTFLNSSYPARSQSDPDRLQWNARSEALGTMRLSNGMLPNFVKLSATSIAIRGRLGRSAK